MKEIRLKIVKLCDNMEERAQGLMNFRKLKRTSVLSLFSKSIWAFILE